MTTVLHKRGKRRRQVKGRITSGSEIHVNITQQEAEIMKLKPKESDPKEEASVLVNNYSSSETKGTDNEKCQHCHKEYQNNNTTSEASCHYPSSATTEATNRKCFVDPVSRSGQVASSAVSMASNMMDSVCFNPVKISNSVANTCGCKSCLERRAIEAEKLLENRLRHAWTQVRHLVRCAYHDPHVLASADSEEFKSYVDLLVSHDPHLLFCRIENTSREYVNDIKTRLLKQLTNGFNTPTLACSFINIMFDEYSHLLNSARTVSSLLRQLEEEHLSRFNHTTWKQHNMHLFQSMVHSEPVIQRTFTEILNQLRQGSAQYDSKHDNLFTSSLIKYLNFDTEMTQISVAWRDVQKLIDDFHDERVEAKRKQCHQKSPPPVNAEPKEKWEFYNIQQETYKQLLAKADTQPEEGDGSKLSLTLKTCSLPNASANDEVGKLNNFAETNGGVASTIGDSTHCQHCQHVNQTVQLPVICKKSETDFPFDSPLNSEESFNEPSYISQPPPSTGRNAMNYFSNDFLRDIRPPSVPSDDDDSSDNDEHSPRIVDHPRRLIPSDLDEEIDSIASISPQPNASDLAPNPFLSFDTSSSNLLLNSVKSYILPSFHHPPPYFPHQHLHHLHKTIHSGSDPVFSSVHTKLRPSSPNVKSKTESTCDPDLSDRLNILLPDPDVAPSLEIPKDNKTVTSDASHRGSADVTRTKEHEDSASKFHWIAPSAKEEITSSSAGVMPSRTLFGEGLYKDSWSSSSSSTQNCDSTVPSELCSVNAARHRHQKLKKKAVRKHKGKSSHKGDLNSSSKMITNTGAIQTSTMSDKESEQKTKIDGKETREDSDSEGEEDADDEYDDEDDIDNEEMCKCEKCIATINFCKVSDTSRHYVPISESKQQYMMQRLEPGISSGGASCECPSCLRLAAVSFFAAQSGQPTTNLVGLPPNSGANISSQFYNSVQDLQSIIHPHLYGLPTVGDGTLFQPTEQPAFSTASGDLQKSADHAEQNDKGQGGGGVRTSASGLPPHHDSAYSASEWNPIGKSANGKLLLATSQSSGSPSLADWSIPNRQAWVNGTGNCSGVLPSHLVAPGCVSAFQQYVNSSTITGPQGFLQPFFPGTGSLPHSGIHPASFLSSAVDNKGLHSSSAPNSVCSSANATANATAESHTTPFFTSSFSPSVTSITSAGSYAPPSGTSAFTPPSNMNYFSSSIYAPISDFSSAPHAPFSTQSHSAGGDMVHVTTAAPVPPIRFHPGTSVSLKEGQFNMNPPGNVKMPSNAPLTPFSAADLQNTNIAQAAQPLFPTTTSLNQPLCLQHNPFLQHNSISSGHNIVGYPNLLPQTSIGAQPASNVLPQALSAGSTANNLQIRQQILRRKKLVAQSKLSRQVRPPLQTMKTNEQPGGQEGAAQNQTSNLQKVRMQLQLTMQDKNVPGRVPNSHLQAPEKMLPATSVGLNFAPTAPTSASSHPQPKGKSPVEETDAPPSSGVDQKPINKASTNSTSSNEKQIASSITQPIEESSHAHHPKHHHPSESCQHLQGAAGNESCVGANNANANTTSTSTTTTNGGGGNNYKYCNCCYCEFFGNGGPPPAHTANNYLEVRDRLRRKLRTNKLKTHDDTEANTHENGNSRSGLQGSLDELVTFIEGGEDGRKKSSKKVKQKQKKEEKRKNETVTSSSPAQFLMDKDPDSELTDGSTQNKRQPVLPKQEKEDKDLTDRDSLVDKDSSTESDLLRIKDLTLEKPNKKKKKQTKKANGQVVGEKKIETVLTTNALKSTSTSSSQSDVLKEDLRSKVRKNTSAETVIQDPTRTAPVSGGKKVIASKASVKKQTDDKPEVTKSSIPKISKESVSKSSAAKTSQDATECPETNSLDISFQSGIKSKAGTIVKEKMTEKGAPQPKPQLEKVNLVQKAPQTETPGDKSFVASPVVSNRGQPDDEDLIPFQPQKLKMTELRLRRLAPRNYNEEQRQHYLAAVKASSSANNEIPEQFKKLRQQKMSNTPSFALQSAERLLNQELRKRIIKAPPQSHPQRSAAQSSIRAKKAISTLLQKETGHANSSHRSQPQEKPAQQDQQRKKKSNTSQVKATTEANQEPTNNNTSGSSTPEKQNEGDSVDVKKSRARKQRKKNKAAQLAVNEGKGEVVDQVFLPRDVPGDDTKEMDDAEKEIESFKRFCLDSTVLNKPKKITVNWKDFAFKKNH